jgi:muramidase (phage lysozyme)
MLIPDFIERKEVEREKTETDTMATTYKTHYHPAVKASAAFEGRYHQPENVNRIHLHWMREFRRGSLLERGRICRRVHQLRPWWQE